VFTSSLQLKDSRLAQSDVEAALAAGIFHREEVPIEAVKDYMREKGIETR
jgi:glutamine amidotransferase/cyclase